VKSGATSPTLIFNGSAASAFLASSAAKADREQASRQTTQSVFILTST
jgi:hypothetical protein